jgi:hypothetical protein
MSNYGYEKDNLYRYEYNLLEKNHNIDSYDKQAKMTALARLKTQERNSWRNSDDTSSSQKSVPVVLNTGQLLADMYAVESGVMECSILASDCMARADEVYDSRAKKDSSSVTLFSPERDFNGNRFMGLSVATETYVDNGFSVTTIIGAGKTIITETKTGFEFSIGLLKEDGVENDDNLGIYAITRENLAFPIVKFVRSEGTYCDFLQFYGENPEDELQSENLYGWGQDDKGSRFSAVEGILDLVESIGSGSKFSQLEVDKYTFLFGKLGLFERFEKTLGVTSIEKEKFIKVIQYFDPNFDLEFQKEYEVKIGKVKTSMTASVEIKPGEDKEFRRVITKREYPTNMPNEVRELIITVDKRTGLLVVDPEGNEKSLSKTDMLAILDVLAKGNITKIERNNLKGLKKFFQKRKAKA